MHHVRVTTITGHEVEITHEEAQRIAKEIHFDGNEFHREMQLHNQHYLEKAERNISDIAARYGFRNISTEDDMKELIAFMLDVDQDVANLLVEVMEQRIGQHFIDIDSE